MLELLKVSVPGTVAHAIVLSLRRLWQEDDKFKANLGHTTKICFKNQNPKLGGSGGGSRRRRKRRRKRKRSHYLAAWVQMGQALFTASSKRMKVALMGPHPFLCCLLKFFSPVCLPHRSTSMGNGLRKSFFGCPGVLNLSM